MTPLLGWYLFLLGLATGCVLLTLTVYGKVSPRWLRYLLVGLSLFVASRYVTMAYFAISDIPQQWRTHVPPHWQVLRTCWYATALGLTTPAVLVIDQLLRHPALSPKKILQWFSPFLLAYVAIILCGRYQLVQDPVVGWVMRLSGWALAVLVVVQAAFVIGFVAICGFLLRQLRSRSVRAALVGLMAAFLYLGLDGVLLVLGRTYFRPFLFSEMLALLALAHAYDVALRRSS